MTGRLGRNVRSSVLRCVFCDIGRSLLTDPIKQRFPRRLQTEASDWRGLSLRGLNREGPLEKRTFIMSVVIGDLFITLIFNNPTLMERH